MLDQYVIIPKKGCVKTVNHQANRVTLAAVNTRAFRVFHPAFQAQQTDMDAAKAQAALIAKEANSDEVRSRLCAPPMARTPGHAIMRRDF